MAYKAQITYPVYELNSTEFMNVVKEVLQVEMLNQRTTHGKTYLPIEVKGDDYLVNPINSNDLNPAFCSIAKPEFKKGDVNFSKQQNNNVIYIISILAKGLNDLRKIADSIYIILNDLDVKTYLSQAKSTRGDLMLFRKESFMVNSLSTEIEERKTVNDKNVLYGNLIVEAQIAEVTQFNTYTPIDSVDLKVQLGNEEIQEITNFNT